LIVENHVEQRLVTGNPAVAFDKAKLAKAIHVSQSRAAANIISKLRLHVDSVKWNPAATRG
jgi:hypothetical protein